MAAAKSDNQVKALNNNVREVRVDAKKEIACKKEESKLKVAASLDTAKADVEKAQMQMEERVMTAMAEADVARKESSRRIDAAWAAAKESNV